MVGPYLLVIAAMSAPGVGIQPVCRDDISGLLGILTFWRPIDNCLVYEDQIVQFNGDRIDEINSWSSTHLVVTTAFGDRKIIDLGRVPRPRGSFWKAPKIDQVKGIMQPYPNGGDLEHEISQKEWSANQVQGIGRPGTNGFCYEIKRSPSRTTAVQRFDQNKSHREPITVRLPADCTPISIRSANDYAYIGSTNSRFGPLLVRTGRREWVLAKDAQRFIPLGMK